MTRRGGRSPYWPHRTVTSPPLQRGGSDGFTRYLVKPRALDEVLPPRRLPDQPVLEVLAVPLHRVVVARPGPPAPRVVTDPGGQPEGEVLGGDPVVVGLLERGAVVGPGGRAVVVRGDEGAQVRDRRPPFLEKEL